MSAIVYNAGNFYIKIPTIAAPTAILDFSCMAIAIEITSDTEQIDVGVMCNAGLQDTGRTTFSAVATFLWEPALYTLLQPHIGVQGEAQLVTTGGPAPRDQTQIVRWLTRYAAQPWGRFEIGQRVEVELPLAVLDTPTWVDLPGT